MPDSEVKNHSKIALVILAAGESKRMKGIKQLLPWKNKTLISHTIQIGLKSHVDSVFVVLGSNYNELAGEIEKYKIKIIKNINWAGGMGTSIACAVQNIKKSHPDMDAVLITLVDQPLIESRHINKLITKYIDSNYNIVSTKIGSKSGVPAIFSSAYYNDLIELNEDVGARKIIELYKTSNYTLNFDDKIVDIDTLEDYDKLFNKFGK